MRTIDFYRLPGGESPVEAFLDSLSGKQAQKVLWVLRIVEKTPSQEIALAIRRKNDYLARRIKP